MNIDASVLTLVIPAYNEADSLPKLLEELIAYCKLKNWKIIIVNDGSTDPSKEILNQFLQEPILQIIHHKVNKGYGGAIKEGIRNVNTKYCVTIDADGQHDINDVATMLQTMQTQDTDLIVGSRKGNKASGIYREFGKSIIRGVAKMMMPLPVYDINSGMKMYDTELAQKYIKLCPDSMAFSDIITLIFIYQKNYVLEIPINIKKRVAGKSTIGLSTATDTIMEIINVVTLFNPLRILLPISLFFIIISILWEIPIFLKGNGISIGALLGFITGLILFFLGLIAEQLGNIRRLIINDNNIN